MNTQGDGEQLGPPPPIFRIGRRDRMPSGITRWLVMLAIALVLYTCAGIARSIYADWLWFQSLGYASVYSTEIVTKIWLFLAGGLLFLVLIGANLAIARRLAPRGYEESFISELEPATLRRLVTIGFVVASVFLAVIFGSGAAGEWTTVLQFLHAVPFGLPDPAFKRDIAFYTFTLPFQSFVQSWLVGAVIMSLVAILGVYAFTFSLQNFSIRLNRAIRAHVGIMLILLLALFMWGYAMSIYQLDFSTSGAVFGATYTDLHARLPAYLVLIAFAGLAALLILIDIVRDGFVLAGTGIVVWLLALIVGLGLYPGTVQRLTVQPNELNKEQEFIQRNIDMTRFGYGLSDVRTQEYPADPSVTAQQVQANADTTGNIRLWDPRPLLQTYSQLQEIRPLYVFPTVTVDRYTIDGKYREVTLSPRELDQDRVSGSARSWVNLKTVFTHGYGAVLSPVNEVAASGLPQLFLKDIPPSGQPPLTKPQLYFGLRTTPYVIVRARDQEFDYPVGPNEDQLTTYSSDSGVQLTSFLRRLVYAWELGDTNILISDQITPQSRLLYRRGVQDRISHIAPFLRLDPDPYLVISNGALYWVQDAYTVSDQLPYSEPSSLELNYIRNSVKVVVNAYSGETTFYLNDPKDPIAQTYASIFLRLFRPISDMPQDLQAHLRYPEMLFQVQSEVYRSYHMTDARTFYNKEDLWDIPQEVLNQAGQSQIVEPYYVIMRLPGESREEFVLIRPFTPANKSNAVAFFAGRSDGANRGTTLAYTFPKSKQVFGPSQIEARIDQTPAISSQFSLWNQSGSHVVRGNLLMIPLAGSYLYVEPIYLQAEQSQLPELQRVIVVNGEQVAMEANLEDSLRAVFANAPPTTGTAVTSLAPASGPPPAPGPAPPAAATPGAVATPAAVSSSAAPAATDVAGLVSEASQDYDLAQQRLRQGDFAGYQQALQQMKAALDRLVQISGTPTPGR
ncbi:MAG TPA: UPF0182 family protein [Dehalococcoidia bacterium]|nr:UPF0182 family protein [Dehalococcoidia bacterium]